MKQILNNSPRLIIIILLAIYTLVLRIPIFNHELGVDGFLIHRYTDLISTSHFAGWILHPLSFIGQYPFSYPSAVPFFLSANSQVTGLSTEKTILMMSIFIAITSILNIYVMSHEVLNSNKTSAFFAVLTTFVFSNFILFIKYTLWRADTRGLFLAVIPLLLLFMFKSMNQKIDTRKIIYLSLILILLLFSIHRVMLFGILFLLVPYLLNIIYTKAFKDKLLFNAIPFMILFISIVLAFLPLTGVITIPTGTMFIESKFGNAFSSEFLNLMFGYVTYISPLIIFAPIGLIFMSFDKKNINPIRSFILFNVLCSSIFIYDRAYALLFQMPILTLLISYGLFSIIFLTNNIRYDKLLPYGIVILVIISSVFSTYIIYINYKPNNFETYNEWIDDKTYNVALFMGNIPSNKIILSNHAPTTKRVSAISQIPSIHNDIDIIATNPHIRNNLQFSMPNLKIIINEQGLSSVRATQDWYFTESYKLYYAHKHEENIGLTDKKIYSYLLSKYNITAYIHYKPLNVNYRIYGVSPFIQETTAIQYKVYDNGIENVYKIGHREVNVI